MDALLAEARTKTERKEREKIYADLTKLISADRPAVFLYAPDFLYIVPPKLQGVAITSLASPEERFAGAYEWYTDSEQVWSIFSK